MKLYIIYLNILKLEELAKDIAADLPLNHEYVEQALRNKIRDGVHQLESDKKVVRAEEGDPRWIFIIDSLDNVFDCVCKISNCSIQFNNHTISKIPLEIAIGTGEFDRDNIVNHPGPLIVLDEIIRFLNTNIIPKYHKWYENEHHNQSKKSTFIVLTEQMAHELEGTGIYGERKYDDNGTPIILFDIDVDKINKIYKIFRQGAVGPLDRCLNVIETGTNGYFIRLDILGFVNLRKEIATRDEKLTRAKVGQIFIKTIEDRVKRLEDDGKIVIEARGGEDWGLATDALDLVFDCVCGILNHKINFDRHPISEIPLEIAIGLYNEKFNEREILKRIATHYRGWYRNEHSDQATKSTFIVLTEEMAHELKDTGMYEMRKYEGNNGKPIVLFCLDVGKVKKIYKIFRQIRTKGPVGPLEEIFYDWI